MSKVVAKFGLTEAHVYASVDGPVCQVKFQAVKDEVFGPHTPSGDIVMTIKNEAAAKVFVDRVGKEFMVHFVPADES